MPGFAPVAALPVAGSPGRPDVGGGGGVYARPLWSWPRVWARRLVPRVFRRATPTWPRVWSWTMPSNTLPPVELTKPEGEDRDFGFDFSRSPEVVGGLTISSAEVLGGSGLTFGTPAVTVAAFDGIAAGKCVTVRISGGSDDTTYEFALRATLSNGRKLVVPARLAVTGNYE